MTKLLLDESVPRRLKKHFPSSFDVHTVQEMGWSSAKNGALLKLASENGFSAPVTADKNIEYQQNHNTLPCPIIVLNSHFTRYEDLLPLVPKIIDLLGDEIEGVVRVDA